MAEQANLATTNDAAEEERPGKLATVEIASARAAQEVQAMVLMAKRFPRDENAAFHRILQACRRKRLADNALYAYPRAGTTISGPTIRMAEVLARSWGNIDFGMVELEQRPGESTMLSYAWDVETNARQTRIFTVKHERHVGKGGQKRIEKLFDPRDIYEMCANMGARRLRACILGIIPNDIVEAAVEECDKTMAGGNKEPLTDRIRTMVDHFASKYGVAKEHIEARLGHKVEVCSETEMVQLRKIAQALQEGMADRESFFPALAQGGNLEPTNARQPWRGFSEEPAAEPPAAPAADAVEAQDEPATLPPEPETATTPEAGPPGADLRKRFVDALHMMQIHDKDEVAWRAFLKITTGKVLEDLTVADWGTVRAKIDKGFKPEAYVPKEST